MATIPIYDITTLPCISYPMENTAQKSKKYQGGYALTGNTKASVSLIAKNDTEMLALYDFWKTDCNFGLEPFLMPIPVFGNTQDLYLPSLLVLFKSDLKATKNSSNWTIKMDLEIYGLVNYVIDDFGQFITSDTGEYVITADGNYVATGNVITSYRYREIIQ